MTQLHDKNSIMSGAMKFLQSLLLILFIHSHASAQTTLTYHGSKYTFRLTIDRELSGDSVNYDCVVKSIAIVRRNDTTTIQTIIPDENYPSCGLPEDQIMIVEDVNFDGHEDIRLIQFLPAAPNVPYYYWVFNPSRQTFVRDTSLEQITSPDIDHKQKVISSLWRYGCCDHGLSTYKYINGKITMIEESEMKSEFKNPDRVIMTRKKLVKGRMKLVERKVERVEDEDTIPIETKP